MNDYGVQCLWVSISMANNTDSYKFRKFSTNNMDVINVNTEIQT